MAHFYIVSDSKSLFLFIISAFVLREFVQFILFLPSFILHCFRVSIAISPEKVPKYLQTVFFCLTFFIAKVAQILKTFFSKKYVQGVPYFPQTIFFAERKYCQFFCILKIFQVPFPLIVIFSRSVPNMLSSPSRITPSPPILVLVFL